MQYSRLVVHRLVEYESRFAPIDLRHSDPGNAAGPRRVPVPLHPRHQPARTAAGHVVHPSGHDKTAVIDDRDLFAEVLNLVELMAAEEHAPTRTGLSHEHLADGVDPRWVQSGQGLIQNEQFRSVHQRGGKLHPLLVPMGEGIHLAVRSVCDAEPLQPCSCRYRCVGHAHPVQSAEVLELLAYEHGRIQTSFLRHVPEAAALVLADRGPVPPDSPEVQLGQSEDGAHRVEGGESPVPASQPIEFQGATHHTRLRAAWQVHGCARTGRTAVRNRGPSGGRGHSCTCPGNVSISSLRCQPPAR
jgi:hypothetical protein